MSAHPQPRTDADGIIDQHIDRERLAGSAPVGAETAYDRLRAMTRGAKGDRPDYGQFLSCADATELLAEIDRARSSSDTSVTTDAETGGVVSRRQFDALRERTAKLLCGLNDEINRLEAELRDLRSARSPESSPAVDAGTTELPYAAVSHSAPEGRAMEWAGPLWDAIHEFTEATPTTRGPAVKRVTDAVHDAMRLAIETSRPAVDDETVKLDGPEWDGILTGSPRWGTVEEWDDGITREWAKLIDGKERPTSDALGIIHVLRINEFRRGRASENEDIRRRLAARRSPESAPEANNG